jgi:hypothetical protein
MKTVRDTFDFAAPDYTLRRDITVNGSAAALYVEFLVDTRKDWVIVTSSSPFWPSVTRHFTVSAAREVYRAFLRCNFIAD